MLPNLPVRLSRGRLFVSSQPSSGQRESEPKQEGGSRSTGGALEVLFFTKPGGDGFWVGLEPSWVEFEPFWALFLVLFGILVLLAPLFLVLRWVAPLVKTALICAGVTRKKC